MAFTQITNTLQLDQFAVSIPPKLTTRVILNLFAGRVALKEQAKSVLMFVDREEMCFGLKFVPDEDVPGSFKLIYPSPKRANRASSITFMGWDFLKAIGWESEARVLVPMAWDTAGSLWVGQLPRANATFKTLPRKGRDLPRRAPRKAKAAVEQDDRGDK